MARSIIEDFALDPPDADQSMCRLYAFTATEPTKVECTLVHAQNALMSQSRRDLSGGQHTNGWGIVTFETGKPHLEKQSWAAYHGEHFKRAAAKIYSRTVLAHIRKATVGKSVLANTHPFTSGKWAFAHNGTVPGFSKLQRKLCNLISDERRVGIAGETDSEHVFAYLLTLLDQHGEASIETLLARCARTITEYAADANPKAKLGLNIMLTDGDHVYGTCLGRSLYYVERKGLYDCEICGFPHIHHDPNVEYWGVVVASEPITHEAWIKVADGSVWRASKSDQSLQIQTIEALTL